MLYIYIPKEILFLNSDITHFIKAIKEHYRKNIQSMPFVLTEIFQWKYEQTHSTASQLTVQLKSNTTMIYAAKLYHIQASRLLKIG